MFDIFDQLEPVIVATRHATWLVATHRLLYPALLLILSVVTLALVSWSLRRITLSSACGEPQTRPPVGARRSLHAYPIPDLRIVSVNADDLTIEVVVSSAQDGRIGEGDPSGSLIGDVGTGLVNTVIVGGKVWNATTHPSVNGGLVLKSRSSVSYPLPLIVSGPSWGTRVSGALVLAFNDLDMNR